MAGTINSLGLGSGVLTSDIIDKLKANDVANIITPINNKITLEQQKGSAYNLLDSLLTTFKSSASTLSDGSLFQQRTVSGNNSAVNVTADAGVAVQSFSITNTQMALKNVKESGAFTSTTSTVAGTTGGTMSLSVGGMVYSVAYTPSTTLEQLKDSINAAAGGSVTASTLQVGTNDYRLVLTSTATGADQTINISDSVGGSLNNSLTMYKKIESQAFTAPTDLIAAGTFTGSETLTVNMGGTNYTIPYNAGTTLQNLSDAINTAVGSTVASIDSNNKLVVKSNVSGFTSNLTLTDNGGLLDPKLTGYTTLNPIEEIQAARDASFKYNGITLTRSSNTITDITPGLTINLLQDDATSTANISIIQDAQAVSNEVGNFVQNYNTLRSQLNDMTTSNLDTGKVGIFNGNNSINSIAREINKIFTSVSSTGLSLPQFGIDLDEKGVMSFNSSTFNAKFNQDPTGTEAFFSDSTTGVFTTMNTLMESYTGTNGIMTTLTTGSTNELKALNENKTRSQAMLDARYATMAARFAAYDSMISRLNNQFSSLQQQISMAVSGK